MKEFSKEDKNFKLKYDISSNHGNIFENMDLGVSIFEFIRDDKEKVVNLNVNYINNRSILNKIKPNEKIIGKTINELFETDETDFYLKMDSMEAFFY